jgi:hypothetical protein
MNKKTALLQAAIIVTGLLCSSASAWPLDCGCCYITTAYGCVYNCSYDTEKTEIEILTTD